MKKTLVLLLIAIPTAAFADQFDDVRTQIRTILLEENVPSLAVAVAKDGEVLWEGGFGWADREKHVRATEHTMYSLASISKPITATGLMVLVERGEVELDRRTNAYLPDAKLTSPIGPTREATVRRLANHTSGLPLHYQFFYADEPHRRPAMDESIRRYGVLVRSPGERWQYANFGYGILDHIISLKSGMSYAEFMRKEVFLPLGLNHTSVDIAAGLETHAAVRYAADQTPLPFYDFDHPGASAVFSSAHDLVRFGMFHLKQKSDEQRAILSDESIDEMQKPTADTGSDRHYGVGWFVDADEHGYKTVSHTGGMGGVRTRLCLVPDEGIAVAVLCNTSSSAPLRMTREILAAMLPKYGEDLRKEPEHKPAVAGRAFGPPELVGYWEGRVSTYAGDRRLEMWAKPNGDVHVQLDGQLRMLVNNSRLKEGRFRGVFPGSIGTDDADRRPHHLHLDTNLRGETITGSIAAMSLPGRKAGNALSYFVELQRIDPSPTARSLFNGQDLDGWHVIDKYDFARHGKVIVDDEQILLNAGVPATGISTTHPFPRIDYEVTLEAKRIEGSDFFCGMTFPVNDNYLSLIIGGWGGGVTGISNLDNMAAVENDTTNFMDFEQDRWYKIRLRVTKDKVEAWIDGSSIVDVELKDRKLSIWWEQEPVRPFGIASWSTKAALRKIRLKRL